MYVHTYSYYSTYIQMLAHSYDCCFEFLFSADFLLWAYRHPHSVPITNYMHTLFHICN